MRPAKDPRYKIPCLLLKFLSSCLYGDATAFGRSLSAAEFKQLLREGEIFGMQAWLYRGLAEILPPKRRAQYQNFYQYLHFQAFRGEAELRRLKQILTEHQLRFVLIKGADLAYRLYPDAALRQFIDWDIWFYPADDERALTVLAADGWRFSELYADPSAKGSPHHYAPLSRGEYKLESHFTLANFPNVPPETLWEHTVPSIQGNSERVLSPELNLLMLVRHAASRSYFHADLPKLLTDAAVVMRREKVDFARLREMAKRWHLPYPGDLLAAFPEFFPPEATAEWQADLEVAARFRKIFMLRAKLIEPPTHAALTVQRAKIRGALFHNLWEYIRNCRPDKIRRVYRLPKRGAAWRLCGAYFDYFFTRTFRVLGAWFSHDRKLRNYSALVEQLENPND